jgi:hypothetical protein
MGVEINALKHIAEQLRNYTSGEYLYASSVGTNAKNSVGRRISDKRRPVW